MQKSTDILLKENQELIQAALDILKEKQPGIHINPDEYTIKVWRGANGVSVDFTRIIRYIPMDKKDSSLYFDVVVNLVNQSTIPFDDTNWYGTFFIPDSKDLEALAFIKKHFGNFTAEFENTIYENEDEFNISCTNEVAFGYYTLNKTTGEQGPVLQGSYEPMIKPLDRNDDSIF